MATQSREPAADLTPEADSGGKFAAIRAMLEREPYSFRFFQAVRLLERLFPERNPVGLFVS
ncbi:MAG: type VI secretion system baseplate subunit TssG, partial [Acidobacteriaceae bacterium]